ncbi:MAG TPA: chemotaxis response regulator protein-glutamate methylesterase [Steroidobacteraceae bacterium]|nr:chemotaxis response regulator protein-glutamate methylesterase [Steroidobacteraceae bacterium]
MQRIKVLVVDDSAVVRQVMLGLLQADPGIEVLGACADPLLAMQRMQLQWPDVIVLDVEMPRMDGLTFLRRLMQERPTPVVICSTLTQAGAPATLEALAAGAVTAIPKPQIGLKQFLSEAAAELTDAIRVAVRANPARLRARTARAPAIPARLSADAVLAPPRTQVQGRWEQDGEAAMRRSAGRVVAIGTSTGGTQALQDVLAQLPALSPGLVIVQHMPPQFTAAFAQRLDGLCALEVREARDQDRVVPGRALIAPGGRHMLLKRSDAGYYVEVRDGPPVNRHCPSVDVLFRSAARCAGTDALGIIMTGMGDDGARGLKEMRDAGAHTVAQDEASCVVFGMPREAIRLEAACQVASLEELPRIIGALRSGMASPGGPVLE